MIAIPTVDGWVHASVMKSLVPQMIGRPLAFLQKAVPIERARNEMVKMFLAVEDATHLFFVDADTVPPPGAVDKLLFLDTDIATGITPILNHDDITSNVFMTEAGEGFPLSIDEAVKEKPYEITGIGLACALIKREVLEKLEHPIFSSLWFQNGKFCEGDIHFCSKAREAGFKIMVDPSVMCGHVKEVQL